MTLDLEAHARLLAPHVSVVRPAGRGPFPVVVQLHDCSGVRPSQRLYAEAARDVGVAAVIVDSFAPRGISRAEASFVCTGMRLRGAERAADLFAALRWLEEQDWADSCRVAAAGWSHGGWAVMEAMVAAGGRHAPSKSTIAKLKLTALFYPYAGPLARTHAKGWGQARPKVFACLAGRDAVVGRAAPRRALRRLAADGLDVALLEFPRATHCFEDEGNWHPLSRYRPDLAEQARAAYAKALAAALTSGGAAA